MASLTKVRNTNIESGPSNTTLLANGVAVNWKPAGANGGIDIYVTNATSTNGVLILSRNDGANVTVDLNSTFATTAYVNTFVTNAVSTASSNVSSNTVAYSNTGGSTLVSNTVQGAITELNTLISTVNAASVKTVNGIGPDAVGNVPIALTEVKTGTIAARPATANNGAVYVVAGDANTSLNGDSYISNGSAWFLISGASMAAYDARYLKQTGGTVSGPVVVANTLTTSGVIANGSVGTAGQVLASNGTATYWMTPSANVTSISTNTVITNNVVTNILTTNTVTATTVTTNSVISNTVSTNTVTAKTITTNTLVSNTATFTTVSTNTLVSNTATFTIVTSNTITANVANITTANISTLSANGSTGTAGQVLTSNGTGLYWSTISGVNTATIYAWTNNHAFNGSMVQVNANLFVSGIVSNNSLGLAGQVLTSNGTKTYWSTPTANVTAISTNTVVTNNVISNNMSVTYITANGSTGTAGQVLTSNGTGSYWATPAAFSVNTADNYTWTNIHTFSSNVTYNANVSLKTIIANGIVGANGQVLASNNGNIYWATPASFSINTAAQYIWTNTHSFSSNVTIGPLIANGSLGTNGQVLASNGNAPYWMSIAGVNTALQYTWTNTHTYNGQVVLNSNLFVMSVFANGSTGAAGQTLTSNGASTYWSNVNTAVNTALTFAWTNTHSFTSNVTIGPLIANGSLGTNGQVLASNGTSTYWKNDSDFATNTAAAYVWSGAHLFGATLGVVGTLDLSSARVISNNTLGVAGQVLTLNGASGFTYWATPSFSVNTAAQYTWTNTHTFTKYMVANNIVVRGSFEVLANTNNTNTISLDNTYHYRVVNTNMTFLFSNWPITGNVKSTTVEVLYQTGGVINWETSVRWPNNIAPILSINNTRHLFMFVTSMSGNTILGSYLTNYYP
jgi:hypothetical protein